MGEDHELDIELVDSEVFMRHLGGDIAYVVGCVCLEMWIGDNRFGSSQLKSSV